MRACVRAYLCAFLLCDILMLKVTALWSLVFVDSVQNTRANHSVLTNCGDGCSSSELSGQET